MGVLHPQIRGIGLRWLRDRKVVEDYRILHGSEETDEYRLSPIRATIERGIPFRRPIAEARAERRIGTSLLDTYLGPQAGRRILAGQILRAQGERMRAVIVMTDMRNFTGLSDRLPGNAVIELLDDYFDAIVSPIQENKGEVLKFMGDGVRRSRLIGQLPGRKKLKTGSRLLVSRFPEIKFILSCCGVL